MGFAAERDVLKKGDYMNRKIRAPLSIEIINSLKTGDKVLLSGTIYTGRDAAHRKMIELIQSGKPLPFDVKDQIIYYVGPCPAPEGKPIGSAGPTTSCRMDKYAPALIEMGLSGMIGKGLRDETVVQAMIEHGAVYFGAIGGAAALISKCIKSEKIIAFEELGTEAVRQLEVVDFPLFVVIDRFGNNLYETGRKEFAINK